MNVIDEIFAEFKTVRSKIEISVAEMLCNLGQMRDSIILYGAGSAGIAFLHYLRQVGLSPRYFADGKPEKWGTECEGLSIIAPEAIPEAVGGNALVIVTINTDGKKYCKSFEEALRIGGHGGVYKRLRDAGCQNIIDYTYFRRCHALFHGDPYNLPSCSDVEEMCRNQASISMVYDWLEDALSKETFAQIVRFRLIDDGIVVPTLPQDTQYFEAGLYPKRPDACFVDCGAFNGISMQTFLKINENCFTHYYGFEPDPYNFTQLQKFVGTLPVEVQGKSTLYCAAAYDKCGTETMVALNGPGSFLADIGSTTVETMTIDRALAGQRATYIKMNIEGAELCALAGAAETIARDKPAIAAAGYHKTWDLWQVPMRIRAYHPGYRFHLRSYMNHLSFVFYCD